jgi:hypothetical protein
MRRNEALEAAVSELERVGIRPQIEHGKHIKLVWKHSGRDRLVVVAHTASDWKRSALNSRGNVRRILRSDGLI